MSKEERQEKIEKMAGQFSEMPKEAQSFVAGYMTRVQEERGEKQQRFEKFNV